MTDAKRRLVLKLVRLQNAAEDLSAKYDEAYEHDSAFDAGEFSGPAIERMRQGDCDRLARRFGFISMRVADHVLDHLDVNVKLRGSAILHGCQVNLPL